MIGDYQSGFRAGKSTIDHIHSIRQLMKKTIEFNMQTHHLFIDFKAAYDNVKREETYMDLEASEIPKKLIKVIQKIMTNMPFCVKIQQEYSDSFEAKYGLRQGDALLDLVDTGQH
ncbi:hypothetical protein J437_LFUL012850 [Ladona fulva]|uniref:Reverse transcriptase domain-containing protein n=1 Tax=Ladona fulva TaxID=123851 RepID=A0A8K0KC39_LADFU|nr:hypothetical protein J437_LFUL012850 [Ladona fulva]